MGSSSYMIMNEEHPLVVDENENRQVGTDFEDRNHRSSTLSGVKSTSQKTYAISFLFINFLVYIGYKATTNFGQPNESAKNNPFQTNLHASSIIESEEDSFSSIGLREKANTIGVTSFDEIEDDTDGHTHEGPTPLNVYDGVTKKFLTTTDNLLYKHFKYSHFAVRKGHRDVSLNNQQQMNQYLSDDFDIQLTLNKKVLTHYHEPLEISWSQSHSKSTAKHSLSRKLGGVKNSDILALYCDSSSSFNDSINFSKPRDVATIAQAQSSSRYHYSQQKLNDDTWYIPSFPTIREEKCHFRLWRKKRRWTEFQYDLVLLAVSDYVQLPSLDTPTGIHLSLTNDPKEMVVQFTTGSFGSTPIVEVTHPNNTITVYSGTSTTYTQDDLCQHPASSDDIGCFVSPGNLHTVKVENLVPDTKYGYRVGLEKSIEIDSKKDREISYEYKYHDNYYSFVTAPKIGSIDQPFAFLAYGDQGCPADGWAMGGNMTANMIERELETADIPIRAIHHFGDLSYARGHAHLWDDWLNMISTFSPKVPLMVGVGNHEYDHTGGGLDKDPSGVKKKDGYRPIWGNFGADSGGECGVPISKRFHAPQTGNGIFWYSHNLGPVHIIMISSEHSLEKKSPQYKWLENDLKNVDRDITPWVILESHRPMYISKEFTNAQFVVEMELRREFESLLRMYGVDLLLAGHVHAYHRTCSGLYKSTCNNNGLTHITVGTAGAKLDKGFMSDKKWTDSFMKEWGYGKLTVYNKTKIHWSFISAHGENEGKVLDELWLTKE